MASYSFKFDSSLSWGAQRWDRCIKYVFLGFTLSINFKTSGKINIILVTNSILLWKGLEIIGTNFKDNTVYGKLVISNRVIKNASWWFYSSPKHYNFQKYIERECGMIRRVFYRNGRIFHKTRGTIYNSNKRRTWCRKTETDSACSRVMFHMEHVGHICVRDYKNYRLIYPDKYSESPTYQKIVLTVRYILRVILLKDRFFHPGM